MSESTQSVFRDIKSNDLDSVVLKPSKISNWKRISCILLGFPNYSLWNATVLVTVIVNYILVSTNLSHDPENVSDFLLFYATFDMIYLINFILLLLHNFWETAKTNLQQTVITPIFFLVLDFFSLLPQIALFCLIYDTRFSFLVHFFRITTFQRLHNMFFLRKKLGMLQQNRLQWILIQYFLVLIVFIHTANFVWYFIECRSVNCPEQLYRGRIESSHYKDWKQWYFVHIYASVQLLLNVGFGETFPKNLYEVYLSIALIITGQVMTVWLVSSFTWYLINHNYHKVFFAQKVEDINRYMEETDEDTKLKTLKYYYALWKHHGGINTPPILHTLPLSLKMDILYDINCGLLNRSILLKNLPEYILRKISVHVKSIYLLPGEEIYSQGVVKTCLVCVEDGILEVLNDEDGESQVITFVNGTILGETALFVNIPSKAIVRALRYTELKVLEKNNFFKVMIHFPNMMRSLKHHLDKRINDVFAKKPSAESFAVPNLRRLKIKLQKNVNNELDATNEDEYYMLYKINSGTYPEMTQGKFSLLKIWTILYNISQVVFCLVFSYYVVFQRPKPAHFEEYGLLLDALCFVDIVLQVATPNFFCGKILTCVTKILDYKLNDWKFNLDIYSLFPMELWSYLFEQPIKRNRFYDLFRLNRLLRLYRIIEIIQFFEGEFHRRYCIGWILKISISSLLFSYYSACIVYLNTCLYEICEDSSWYQLRTSGKNESIYLTVHSMYFAVMLSFSNGLGGFLTESYTEIALVISIILLAALLQNFLLGQVISSAFLENFHKKQPNLRYYLKNFSSFHCMSSTNYRRLRKILRIDPNFYEETSKKFIEKTAPQYLVMLLQASKIKNILMEVPFFQMVDGYFLTFIEKQAKIFKLPNNEYIYSVGELTRQMFVIQKGYCNIYNAVDALERTVGPGTQLGLLEMLFCLPKKHTIVTSTDCVIIRIEYETIHQILELFPKESSVIENVVRNEILLTEIRKLQSYEETDDNFEFGGHNIFDQSCFINLTKNWPNYCEVYRQKLGSFWFCGVLLMPVSIHPEGFFIILWCAIRCLFIVILGIIEPIMILAPPFADELYWWKVICHSSLYIDMYILMHVAYFDGRGYLKIHPAYTSWYYFCHGFFLDLLAALPWELLVIHLDSKNHDVTNHSSPHFHHCYWNLVKLIQFYKVFNCLSFFDENIFGAVKLLKLSKIFLAIVLVINITANLGMSYYCQFPTITETTGFGWYGNKTSLDGFLRCKDGFWKENSMFDRLGEPFEKFMIGVYTVVNFMTHTGADDVTAASEPTQIGATIMIFIGIIVFAIFTAVISSLILEEVVGTVKNPQNVSTLMKMFDAKGLATDLRKKSFRHFEFIWRRNGGSIHQSVENCNLDVDLTNVLLSSYKNVLQDVPLFYSINTNFLRVIVEQISVQQFLKGEVIVRYKDVLSDIYIVANGDVDISNQEKEFMHTIGPTGVFGNISKSAYSLSGIQVVARKNVELWVLNTEKLLNTIKFYSVVTEELDAMLKNKPNYMMPIVSSRSDIPYELETEQIPANRKSSILLMKYRVIQFCIPHRWFKFSLEYNHEMFKFVDALTLLASIINILTIPYVFVTQERSLLGYLYLMLEPIFYLRIFFKLHRSYVNFYGNLIQSNEKLCNLYLNSPIQLFWDVVPNFPIGLMCFIFPKEEWFFFYTCLRLLHFSRFYYITQYFNECNNKLCKRPWLLLAKLVLYYSFLVHLLACMWFMLACPFDNCNAESWISRFEDHIFDKSTFYRMTLSYYYILTVLTTTGIANITSGNIIELTFTTVTMLIGKIMISIFIGAVLRTIHCSENRIVEYENKSNMFIKYLEKRNVPAHLIQRTWLYVKNIWDYGKGSDPAKLIHYLPEPLKQDIVTFIYGRQLRETFLFKNIDEALLRAICTKLIRKIYFQGDYIVKHGDVNSTMYFIHQGNVSVLTKQSYLTEIPHVMLHPKDLFGVSQGLNLEEHHTFFYRASSTVVEVLTLNFDDWSYLLALFPRDHLQIFSTVEREYLQ